MSDDKIRSFDKYRRAKTKSSEDWAPKDAYHAFMDARQDATGCMIIWFDDNKKLCGFYNSKMNVTEMLAELEIVKATIIRDYLND